MKVLAKVRGMPINQKPSASWRKVLYIRIYRLLYLQYRAINTCSVLACKALLWVYQGR
jgi:hypothetical protein